MDLLTTFLLVGGFILGVFSTWISHNDDLFTIGFVIMCVSIIGLWVKFHEWLMACLIALY